MMCLNIHVGLIVCVLISVSVTAPISEDGQAKIFSYKNENNGLGNYEFSFETSNGILRRETGKLVNIGETNEQIKVEGTYTYTDPEGKLVVVNYSADENGFHIDEEIIQLEVAPHVVASLLG